ncbi:MAG: class I SAM-dependent methyltransferase [Phenylobacterium sp.]|uniref:class I SAM-dependent methyltransferase n=1 Tax=Phenylobacterium sp. TaxID=1871053 RepID=UPI0025D015AC|nr:class I SAM-dependent methyltransferase [Phenylobacterium sp.]MCA3712078.1 class I SAM-dependent methyltransferase [Phenylobacterium sp.]MCA6241602.1 class I SAM-dependent methyltransferase [Phenylobacterium sp.]MCA6260038.1 class I SAM-dependent methyltransferase [Phenylobacterium sp.]
MLESREWFSAGSGIDRVQGFITPRSVRAIRCILDHQEKTQILGSIAEIGTFRGKTFVGLAAAARDGERVVGVDIFPEDVQQSLLRSAAEFLSEEQRKRIVLVKRDSSTLDYYEWSKILGEKARFVHVDGNHTITAVRYDIMLSASHLCVGGIVLIDDFLHDWYPDVTEGIIDALKIIPNIVPVAVIPRSGNLMNGGTKLICSERSSADLYSKLILSEFSDKRPRGISLAGSNVISFMNMD